MKKAIPLIVTVVLALGIVLPSFQEKYSGYEPIRLSGAMQGMQFLAQQRAYPGSQLPARGYVDAFEFVRDKMAPDTPEKSGSASWRAMGPANIWGRTLAVALNPQNPTTIYAGSASGGLWRSYTGGVGAAAWEQVRTGHPVLGVSSICFAPGDSSVMYIGTGEMYSYDDTQGGIAVRLTRGSFGIGVLKSIDGGETWFKSLDWSYDQQRAVHVVRVDPQNPAVVWAGTSEGTWKSTDAGVSWAQVDDTVMVTDLVINSASPDTVIISCGDLGSAGTGIYRTTDGGGTWAKVAPNGVSPDNYLGKAMLAIGESDPNVVYASIGNGDLGYYSTWLLRSVDAGTTWTWQNNTDYSRWQGWFAHDVACSPSDPDRVICVGIDIWRSVNGGVSLAKKSDWAAWFFGTPPPGGPEGPPNYSHADHHDVVFHPTNHDIIYFANDGGIFRSINGGQTFHGCNGGYQTQQFYAGFSSSPQDPNLAMGGMQDNSTAIYTGTNAWTRVIGGDGSWTGIDPTDDLTLYGSAQNLYLVRSNDGGNNWNEISPPGSGGVSFIAPFGLGGPAEPDVIYAGRTVVFKSTAQGAGWTATNGWVALDNNPCLALEVSQTDSDVVYATTAPVSFRAGVHRTLDGGTTWQNVTGSLPDRYPVGLAIDPNDDMTAYVTFSGFGTSHVFKTTNGGGVWTDIGGGLPDVPTQAVVVDPLDSDNVYVGTDLGVFASVNGGSTWFDFSADMPEAIMVMDLTISPVDRMLRASTYGNGAYERALIGVISGVDETEAPGLRPVLAANHPNPFNPRTRLAFFLPEGGRAELSVFDPRGRRVVTVAGGWFAAGRQEFTWDGRDARGREVASGTYLYRLSVGSWSETRKMQLVR